MFSQLMSAVENGQSTSEVGAAFYLRFAETLAVAEDVGQRYAAYMKPYVLV